MGQLIVVFPHSGLQNALTDSHRRWMSPGVVQIRSVATEPLHSVLAEIGVPPLENGIAALRYLGQTGRTADSWIAAADPINFEARLRDIVAHRITPGQLAVAEFESVVTAAQDLLAREDGMRLETIEQYGYLRSNESMQTATVSPTTLHGFGPDDYLPSGDDGRSFHRINSELQMLFHDHIVNQRRAERGLPAINGLWIWGGGELPAREQRQLPALFGDEPLFCGYWEHFGGRRHSWNANIGDCIRAADGFAVITVPEASGGAYDHDALALLDQLCVLLGSRRITQLTMIFNNEVSARLKWSDRLKFWRRGSDLFPEGVQND